MSLSKQDKINQLKNEISELEKETERLSATESAVKIVLNGASLGWSAVVKPI